MERDDKRMPIGAAVTWVNARRRGECGYVVEGTTTHATVVREDGARLRIRWGGLLAGDRASLRTIVTDFDRAQVCFEVGDAVVFTARDGSTMLGTVEKLNPKRARVRCAQSRWDVPYVVLRHREAPARDRGGERLDEVAKEARALMDAHGLEAWTFRFAASQRRLGACLARAKVIEIGRWHAARGESREVTDTILHEIAHALAGAKAGHGPAWKAIATRIGATPRANEGGDERERNAAARSRFGAGMRVSFEGRGGRRYRGVIAKMNPKRARVVCVEGVFVVHYGLLAREEGGVERPSAH